jgi:predicted Zn-dependent protease
MRLDTNQLDDTVLRAVIRGLEALNREMPSGEPASINAKQVPDEFVPVQLWHDETVQAMATHRQTVMPLLLGPVAQEGLLGAGFIGLMAKSEMVVTKEGISAFYEETDSEVNLTARSRDGTSSGWGGQAARNWAQLDIGKAASRAIETAKRGARPVALEPGRRTAILSATAVAQLTSRFKYHFDAEPTEAGYSALSDLSRRRGGKMHQRIFDSRLTMRSDPADPEAGYSPYFSFGYATVPMTWVENGILKNLRYDVKRAVSRGKPYTSEPEAFRMTGGTTTIDAMIAQCEEGIFVNRFADLTSRDIRSGLMTGATRDGCFFVRHGKIEKAVKNFRVVDSPFFFLNKIDALGVPERAAFGYVPSQGSWPRPPVIVPPMMVRDFNFASMVDAV